MIKNLILIFAIGLLLTGCKSKSGSVSTSEKPGTSDLIVNPGAIVKVEVAVEGMSCTGCESTINGSVGEVAGVVEVSSSFQDGKAVVKYDSTRADLTAISKAISDKGYTVKGYTLLPADSASVSAVQ